MKTRLFLPLLLAAAARAGCATGPDFKTYSATLPPVAETQGRIWFYRPSKIGGSLVQPEVNLNGEKVGKAQPGCFFYADRAAGEYEVKCTTEWSDTCKLTLATKETTYVRLGLMVGLFVGHIIPKEVGEADALKELEGCRLITADGANADLAK
jgi:hypothetical protein